MNIFENAKFGDKFLTSDGRVAVYFTQPYGSEFSNSHRLVVQGEFQYFCFKDDGKNRYDPIGIDIVSRLDETHWHKTDDGDLPTESGNYWCKMKTKYEQGSSHYKQHCSDGYCILQWLNKKKQWNTRYTKQEDIIAWCELPKFEE